MCRQCYVPFDPRISADPGPQRSPRQPSLPPPSPRAAASDALAPRTSPHPPTRERHARDVLLSQATRRSARRGKTPHPAGRASGSRDHRARHAVRGCARHAGARPGGHAAVLGAVPVQRPQRHRRERPVHRVRGGEREHQRHDHRPVLRPGQPALRGVRTGGGAADRAGPVRAVHPDQRGQRVRPALRAEPGRVGHAVGVRERHQAQPAALAHLGLQLHHDRRASPAARPTSSTTTRG